MTCLNHIFKLRIIAVIAMISGCLLLMARNQGAGLDPASEPLKDRVVVCVNSGKVLTDDEIRRVQQLWVKDMEVSEDTVRLTLRGPSVVEVGKRLKPSYRAEMEIDGEKCRYSKDELTAYTPKTSQYMLSDSCFYLTFDLAPKFQTKGEKTWISMFMILDSIPEIGKKYPVSTVRYDENIPIKEWKKSDGSVVTLQMVYLPLCGKMRRPDMLVPELQNKRVILNSVDISNGYVEVLEFQAARRLTPGRIKLRTEFDVTLSGLETDDVVSTLSVRKGVITLSQVQEADIKPMLFEIDYGWQDRYLPADSYD